MNLSEEKNKSPKLIPKLDYKLIENLKKTKINSEAWYEIIEIIFSGSNYVLNIDVQWKIEFLI